LASILGGEVKPCHVTLGATATARHCVTGRYLGMQLETYVYRRGFEVWVQNFRLRESGEVAFCVGRPGPGMGLIHAVSGALPEDTPPVFARADTAEAARRFLADPAHAAPVARLGLQRGESLMVVSRQMILRSRQGHEPFLRSRLDALAALFAAASDPRVTPALLAPHVVEIAAEDDPDAPSWFGGPAESALECRTCTKPLHQVLTLDADGWPLAGRLPSFHRFPVALCLSCQTMSAAVVLRLAHGRWTVWSQAAGEPFDDVPPVLPRRAIHIRPADGASGARPGPAHRLGGQPDWLQAADAPDCPGCAQAMAFLAQLDGDDALGISFGDDGRLYAFACVDCRAVATVVQSH
jgi:hypothetical protein